MQLAFVPATDPEAWDAYVARCPDACSFHSSEWKQALSASFPQYRADDFFVESGGRRVGAWSGFTFAPAPFLRFAESSPWHLFGGLLLERELGDSELFVQTVARWESEARRRRYVACALTPDPTRFPSVSDVLQEIGFRLVAPKFTHVLDLPADDATLWQQYKGSVRTDVRKADRSNVVVRPAEGPGDVADFYAIYAETMARFGSPAKPRSLVRHLAFSAIGTLLVAEREGRVIAGLLHLHFARTLTIWMAASLPSERRYGPNHALYHAALTWGIENGYSRADFGASPPENTGLVRFKQSFGATRADFGTFRKEIAPLRMGLWRLAEPVLRGAYRRLQMLNR